VGIDNLKKIEAWDNRYRIVRDAKMFAGVDRQKIQNADVVKLMDLNDQYNGSGIAILSSSRNGLSMVYLVPTKETNNHAQACP